MLRKYKQLRRPKIAMAIRGTHRAGNWLRQRGEKQPISLLAEVQV
jgi:hypothetical protein